MNQQFLGKLERVRQTYGKAMPINSAWRCAAHNAAEGGADKSFHLLGRAVDCAYASPFDGMELLKAAIGVGLSVVVYRSFLHLDDRPGPSLLLVGAKQR